MSACHWKNWQTRQTVENRNNTATALIDERESRLKANKFTKKTSMVGSEWGHYYADTNQGKENTSLFMVNSLDGMCVAKECVSSDKCQ